MSKEDILERVECIQENNPLLTQLPTSPQERFDLTYAAIYFINKGKYLPIIEKLLQSKTGSTSEVILRLKYMKQCMEKKIQLDNKQFNVLFTLVQWMQEYEKVIKSKDVKLTGSVMLPHPNQLKFQYYEEYIVYLNYLAADIQNLFKVNTINWNVDDLQTFLIVSLPRIHHNVIIPSELLNGGKKQKDQQIEDILFLNASQEYFIRTRQNYRAVCKLIFNYLNGKQLSSSQQRQHIEIACKYFLLFREEPKQQAKAMFNKAFDKCSEAVKFSLNDQLLLFFKVCEKLGAVDFLDELRRKWQWIDKLLIKYEHNVIGHPKDDVNAYNPLGLKEKFTVDAGKTVQKTLEIYQDETLFYFKVNIVDNNINIRLFYNGDFGSKIQMKKLLNFDEKKEGENRFAYLAGKKGIYTIEFDNSYSWLNSKTITYQYVILSPIAQQNQSLWYQRLFQLLPPQSFRDQSPKAPRKNKQFQKQEEKKEKSPSNTLQRQEKNKNGKFGQDIEEEQEISIHLDSQSNQKISKKQEQVPQIQSVLEKEVQVRRQSQQKIGSTNSIPERSSFIRQDIQGQANLSLIDNIFSLLVNTQDHTYQFQTNLNDRIEKRLKSYCSQHYQWILNSEARDWVKKNGFSIMSKGGITLLSYEALKRQSSKRSDKE